MYGLYTKGVFTWERVKLANSDTILKNILRYGLSENISLNSDVFSIRLNLTPK